MLLLWQRVASCILLIALVAMRGMCGAAQSKTLTEKSPRYLYILDCVATLEKFDLLSRKRLSTVNLAKHSTLIPTHGDQANSVVDGCSTYGAAYQAKTAMLYTVSPTTGSIEEGAVRHFRILAFRLSDLKPAAVINLPGKYDYDDSPTLTTDRSGQIGVIAHNHYSRIEHGRLIPASMPSMPSDLPGSRPPSGDHTLYELALSAYHSTDAQLTGRTDKIAYQAFERSGDTVLIKVPLFKQGWVWVVADAATYHLTHLNLPFHSTDDSVHLAPGGKVILAQEASYSPGRVSMTKGRLALIDAGTGAVIRTWTDPALDRNNILTVTPQGEMVIFSDEPTTLTPIDIHPSGEPVIDLRNSPGPYFFYTDR